MVCGTRRANYWIFGVEDVETCWSDDILGRAKGDDQVRDDAGEADGMNNFGTYMTPAEYWRWIERDGIVSPFATLDEVRAQARSDERCSVCGFPAWKLADTGLCFTCTTGEADASADMELVPDGVRG